MGSARLVVCWWRCRCNEADPERSVMEQDPRMAAVDLHGCNEADPERSVMVRAAN